MKWTLGVHGGAGNWELARHQGALAGVRSAAERGAALLEAGKSALDTVCAVVVALEDDPVFNAGTGSVLNREGEAEMDASVMTGHDLCFGGVGALMRVRNPVQVARAVMEHSTHALLVGEGAQSFARARGFDDYDPITPEARIEYRKKLSQTRLGTVGAVALDTQGRMAAATSTGGVLLKLPGRVGDSALPGAGNYATAMAAVSATGKGELIMRVLAAKSICDFIGTGLIAQESVDRVIASMRAGVGADGGFIAVSADGSLGVAHGTAFMVHAYCSSERPQIKVGMKVPAV